MPFLISLNRNHFCFLQTGKISSNWATICQHSPCTKWSVKRRYQNHIIPYLIHGTHPVSLGIDRFISRIKHFNLTTTSEVLSSVYPERYVAYSAQHRKACDWLIYTQNTPEKDIDPATLFDHYQKALKPVIAVYVEEFGDVSQTGTSVLWELEYFLNFVAEKMITTQAPASSYLTPSANVWTFSPKDLDLWEIFYQKGFMSFQDSSIRNVDINGYDQGAESPALRASALGLPK